MEHPHTSKALLVPTLSARHANRLIQLNSERKMRTRQGFKSFLLWLLPVPWRLFFRGTKTFSRQFRFASLVILWEFQEQNFAPKNSSCSDIIAKLELRSRAQSHTMHIRVARFLVQIFSVENLLPSGRLGILAALCSAVKCCSFPTRSAKIQQRTKICEGAKLHLLPYLATLMHIITRWKIRQFTAAQFRVIKRTQSPYKGNLTRAINGAPETLQPSGALGCCESNVVFGQFV